MSNERQPTGEETVEADPPVSDESPSGTDLDSLFEILADEQRREILVYLDHVDDGVAAFSDLIEHVADESEDASSTDRDQLAVTLHHNHLPKLSDADIVEYDTRSERVRYRGGPVVTDWLELARSYESRGLQT